MSVNVGLPKDVRRTVFTGVFKEPVSGPRHVGKLNLDGDGQGDLTGHTGRRAAPPRLASSRTFTGGLSRSCAACAARAGGC